MMEIKDIYYQSDAVETILETKKNCLIQAPTGAGKTIIMGLAINRLVQRGQTALILAHRGELIIQAIDKFSSLVTSPVGAYSSYIGIKQIEDVTVATYQSFGRMQNIPKFDYIFIDEVHRLPWMDKKSMYKKIIDAHDSILIGVTATPFRMRNLIYGIGDEYWFQRLDYKINMREIIEKGFLVDYKYKVGYSTSEIRKKLDKVKMVMGDYDQGEIEDIMKERMFVKNVYDAIDKQAKDRKKIVVFCTSIKHAELLDTGFDGKSVCVHSRINKKINQASLEGFNSGDIRVIFSIGILTEGWDSPVCDCAIIARPTKSPALHVQMPGRALRTCPGKVDALILDIVGNYHDHGSIEDPRVYKKKKGDPETHKVCPNCLEVYEKGLTKCPECGYEEPKSARPPRKGKKQDVEDLEFRDIKDTKRTFHTITAKRHTTKAGRSTLKVEFYHTEGFKPVRVYYPLDAHWPPMSWANIIRRKFPKFKNKKVKIEDFLKGVEGSHLVPFEGEIVDGNFGKKIKGI